MGLAAPFPTYGVKKKKKKKHAKETHGTQKALVALSTAASKQSFPGEMGILNEQWGAPDSLLDVHLPALKCLLSGPP